MLDSFLKYLEYEKRYSKHTLTSYNNDLRQFQAHLSNAGTDSTLGDANHYQVRSWVIELVEDGLQPKSINRKIASIRSFYKYLLRQGKIKKDPTTKVKVLKASKKLPQFVSENDILSLLDKSEFDKGFSGLRDRLVLELLYGTGIRLAELISLKSSNVNIINSTLKVLGKRNKERVIPFSKSLGELIGEYSTERKKLFQQNENDALILTDSGKSVYPMFVYRLVKKYLNLFTTIDKRSPHVLRHTFATHLLNKGAELNAVKDLLGHTSLTATQVYTHNSLEKLKSVFDQAHPKA